MKKTLLLSIVCFSTVLFVAAVLYRHGYLKFEAEPEFYLGGIQINEPDNAEWARTLHTLGMNTVSVTVYARHHRWDSPYMQFDRADTAVVDEIRAAKAQGLHVALILRVLLDSWFPENEFLWHGMIMPDSDDAVRFWFKSYSEYASLWATIAEREKVDLFLIGSELRSLTATKPAERLPDLLEFYTNPEKQRHATKAWLQFENSIDRRHLWVRGRENYPTLMAYLAARQRANVLWAEQVSYAGQTQRLQKINLRRQLLNAEWLNLIATVRKHYHGQVGYAANFDNFQDVGFWQQLDFIGINAYFKLRHHPLDSLSNLELYLQERWEEILFDLEFFRHAQGLSEHPILFTELGYTYRANSTLEPWSGSGFSLVEIDSLPRLFIWEEQPVDFQERALAIRALYQAHEEFNRQPLKGLLYWKLSTKVYHQPHEPFMLLVSPDSDDPMLPELQKFTRKSSFSFSHLLSF